MRQLTNAAQIALDMLAERNQLASRIKDETESTGEITSETVHIVQDSPQTPMTSVQTSGVST